MNMSALILVPAGNDGDPNTGTPATETDPGGRYDWQQDPDSGAYIQVWIPDTDDVVENPLAVEGGLSPGRRFKCMARAITDGGIRVAGTTERFSSRGTIDTVDFVRIIFPPNVILTRRDRVTDIRNSQNHLLWKEEEFDDSATIFEVNGTAPIVDPWGKHVENMALLQRAEIQR
jgi:hypothetical protein